MIEGRSKIILCNISEIQDPGSLEFAVETSAGVLEIFLIRKGKNVYGYHNQCPHTGVCLNWMPDQFLDLSGSLIQCATHGALFRIEDGYCLRGPCAGENLKKFELTIEDDGEIYCAECDTTGVRAV